MKNKKSFSLIEVVIATGILLMFLGAGLLLTKGSLNSAVAGKARIQAAMTSNKLIEEIRVLRDTLFFQNRLDDMKTVFQNLCFDSNLNIITHDDPNFSSNCKFRAFCYSDESLSHIDSTSTSGCGGVVANRICLNKDLGAVLPENDTSDCSGRSGVVYRLDVLAKSTGLGIDMMNMIVKANWLNLGISRNFTLPTYLRGCDKGEITVSTAQPVDVAHVYDRTGSMSECWTSRGTCPVGSRKIDSARSAISSFNNRLRETVAGSSVGDKVGASFFADSSQTSSKCILLPTGDSSDDCRLYTGAANFSSMTNRINQLEPSGVTPLAAGIAKGTQLLASDGSSDRLKAMIVTTDGIANVGLSRQYCMEVPGNPCEMDAISQAQIAKNAGFKIFVIGIGGDVNESALMQIASQPSYYRVVHSGAELQDFYTEIFNEISRGEIRTICPGNDNWHQ